MAVLTTIFVSHEEENHWSWSIQMKSKNIEMMSSVMGSWSFWTDCSLLEINWLHLSSIQIHSIIVAQAHAMFLNFELNK